MMKGSLLFFLISYIVTLQLASSAAAATTRNLRSRSLTTTTSTSTTTSASFAAQLQLGVMPGTDRWPTFGDYKRVATAFASWFHANSRSYYDGTTTTLPYLSTTCEFNSTETTWIPTDQDYPHTIALDCTSLFNTTSNKNAAPVQYYALTGFITEYLFPAVSTDSVFQTTNKIRYTIRPILSTAPVLTTTPNTATGPGAGGATVSFGGATASVGGTTTQAENRKKTTMLEDVLSPVATTPAPTTSTSTTTITEAPSPAPVVTTSSPTDMTITTNTTSIALEWTLGPPADDGSTPPRAPTSAEWETFRARASIWLVQIFAQHYHGQEGRVQLVGMQTTYQSKAFVAAPNSTYYTMVLSSEVKYRLQTPGQDFPDQDEWVALVSSRGLDGFRDKYLARTEGIFQNPATIQWKAV